MGTLIRVSRSLPPKKSHPIVEAQDVLTRYEKSVYAILWGSDPSDDEVRFARKGYDAMAKESRITKRNIANIIQRLMSKGFLKLLAPPIVYGERKPATYVVLSCAAVRENQKQKGLEWVIHSGRGISYAPERKNKQK